MKRQITLMSAALMLTIGICMAQTPTDAIMMNSKQICVGLLFEHGSWDHYWEGDYLRTNETVATLSRNTLMPMLAIGVHDRVNVIVGLPYVRTKSSEPNGGKFEGAKGFQDVSVAIKGQLLKKSLGSGELSLLSTIGFSTPATNYLSDYRPYSIGFGAWEFSGRGIAQYQLENGLYARTTISYLRRGQTEAERDYYYNNGSYYTAMMDVPDAWNFQFVTGVWLLDYSLKLEGSYVGLKSTSGDDVRPYNAAQPTNKVQSDMIGFTSQYYFPNLKGLGVLAYCNQVVNGRNVGKFFTVGGGVTYFFDI